MTKSSYRGYLAVLKHFYIDCQIYWLLFAGWGEGHGIGVLHKEHLMSMWYHTHGYGEQVHDLQQSVVHWIATWGGNSVKP
jgi:hypothetical protein